MPETENSLTAPQLSGMFQKFALSFKSKAFEFFSDDSEKYSLLDSPEDFAAKPLSAPPESSPVAGKGKRSSNAQFNQTLIASLFATISSFEASYLQLQTAHVPNLDEEAVKIADKAIVSHLQTLSEFKELYKNYYQNPSFNIEFSTGSCLEFQVNENQHKLRALKSVFNRLQSEIDVKDDEVFNLRQKLEEIEKVNVNLSKKLSFYSKAVDSSEVLLTLKVFDKILLEAFSVSHKFTKILIDLMKKAQWDFELAANSVYSGVTYAKKGHSQYALLSYVCLRMFHGFDSENFGLIDDLSGSNGHVSTCNDEDKNFLNQLKDHVSSNPMEILRKNPNCEFSRFCEMKYQQLIHPTMESSIFSDLDQSDVIVSSWKSLGVFYELFVKMASSIWALHKLAFSFNPQVDLFQVASGVEFSMVYMEDITNKYRPPSKSRPKVEFTVLPGFKIGQTVIQSRVYLTGVELAD